MDLTRRDALAALAAAGVAVGAGGVAIPTLDDSGDGEIDGHARETVVAVARVVYPPDVDGIEEFVVTYIRGKASEDPEFVDGVQEAVGTLDAFARDWYEGRYRDLDPATRDDVLRELGVSEADPDPDGFPGARVRYYLVNELLFALYASPTGGELAGIENPQGHPGGLGSYRRGPGR